MHAPSSRQIPPVANYENIFVWGPPVQTPKGSVCGVPCGAHRALRKHWEGRPTESSFVILEGFSWQNYLAFYTPMQNKLTIVEGSFLARAPCVFPELRPRYVRI